MKLAGLALLAGSAAAFAPNAGPVRASVAVHAAVDDLKALAEKSNPVLKVSGWYPCQWMVPI